MIGTVLRAAIDVEDTVFFDFLDLASAGRVVREGPDLGAWISAVTVPVEDDATLSWLLSLLSWHVFNASCFRLCASSSLRSCSSTASSSSS